jgi:surface protein
VNLILYSIWVKTQSFNGDISEWNVSNVLNMGCVFFRSKFNNDISKWNVSKVNDMGNMFKESEFNQDISKWNTSRVRGFLYIFDGCPIKEEYKPKFNK